MGACDFQSIAVGKTAQEAFRAAVEEAAYEHGHGGYTGTIAEKQDFVMIPFDKALGLETLAKTEQGLKERVADLESRLAKAKDGWFMAKGWWKNDPDRPEDVAGGMERLRHFKKGLEGIPERRKRMEKGEVDEWAAQMLASKLIEEGDERVDDKWGPAGCIEIGPVEGSRGKKRYLFFGLASS
jgi:hypothetical protein